jgi:serine/threonine-protein kinase
LISGVLDEETRQAEGKPQKTMGIEPGQKIGDYQVVGRLGAGGLGVVYEVEHLIAGRREAMKLLSPDQSGAAQMAERFRREVQTLASLNHVNIAALHTAFYSDGQLAMVMELVRGQTLADLRQARPISIDEALDIGRQILQALIYAHRLGVVHRDIKPSNVMISPDGVVKLLDFGIAFKEQSTHLTQTGYILGSLSYMPPELVNGGVATPRSDLYSVGVTLYETLTGTLPITGATNYEILMNHVNQVPVAPHTLAPQIPVAVSNAILRALEKDPASRFASAAEFLQALKLAPEAHAYAETATIQPPEQMRAAAQRPGNAVEHRQNTAHLPPAANSLKPPAETHKPNTGSGFESLPLEELYRNLAVYIGPVAKFVVRKLAARSADLDVLYNEAAKEIASPADRAAFLKSRSR